MSLSMKILFHNYYNSLNINNKLFADNNSSIGDNLLKPFNELSKFYQNKGISVGTYAKINPEEADIFVFIDYPKNDDPIFEVAKKSTGKKIYLLVLESPIVNLNNFNTDLHDIFEYVFTWSDDQVKANPAKYKKIFYSYEIPNTFPNNVRDKLCTIISGNKLSRLPNELYSERMSCIKWFEKNASNDFDLYGTDWDIIKFNNDTLTGRILNKTNKKFKLFKQKFSVYKGTVESKHTTLSEYKFCICFENVYNHNGYITEKIFDCFFAGNIPIYKGAKNVLDYIPQNCFIDYNQFNSVKEMYTYIKSLSASCIEEYQENIKNYLKSTEIQNFSIQNFSETIVKYTTQI